MIIGLIQRSAASSHSRFRHSTVSYTHLLNDLAASFEGRNEYISRLCRYPLLILDDFGMERGTEYGLSLIHI